MINFNEKEARSFYKWLGHTSAEYTELRIIPWPSGSAPVIQCWVQDEESFIKICHEWSGKRQCYVGINPRSCEGGEAKDVSRVVGIPFDVDSKKPKNSAATDEEVEQAKQRMIELVSWVSIQGYKQPFIVMSGNGYHVLQRVNIDVDEDTAGKLESYFHEASTEGMDSIFDLPRILKIPGTMSVKGSNTEDRPHRLSFIVSEGDPQIDHELGQYIAGLSPYVAPISPVVVDGSVKKDEKRRTGSLRPCFKRFAEEGGNLSTVGSEDNLLRLALVIEAHSKRYSRAQILELFTRCEDYDPKITRDKVDHQLGKIAVEGIKSWSCLAIYKHGGCLGETCSRYKRHVAKHIPRPPPDPDQPVTSSAFFDDNDKFVPNYLVDYIIQSTGKEHILTPTTKKGGDFSWWYNSKLGVFQDDGASFLKGKIKQLLGDKARNHMIEETVKLIQIETYIDRKEFEETSGTLVLQNGVFHLDTEELTEYSPHYHAKTRWPITYDSDAKCPAILKFLDEVIPGRTEDFLEWLGYHFFKDYRYQVILMLIGDGENGKSILLLLLRTFLGGSNVTSVKLYDLIRDRFAGSRLYGKTGNIYPDIDQEELKYTGFLKALTGNDWIDVQEKHFQMFSMRNYAKLSFSTNKMPKTTDRSRAYYRRWLVVTCPNFFIKGENRDPDIISKITTPQELSGLFNLAIKGRHRLIKNGGFNLGTVEERQKVYEELMDPITAFVENCIQTTDPNGVVPKDILYKLYFQFCKFKGYTPELRQTFTKKLHPSIIALKDARITISGKRTPCWTGISMKPDSERPTCAKCLGFVPCVHTQRLNRSDAGD